MRNLPIILSVFLCACGSGIHIFSEQTTPTPGIYALLPIKHGPTLREQDAAYITRVLQNSLESQGVTLLDPVLIQETCLEQNCPERTTWSTILELQGIIAVDITSNWDSNIIAAHYSTLSGTLKLSDRNDKKLLEVQHRESERGGLLFDSGQVISGLSSQAEYSDSESFRMLAKKFARNLALAVKPYLGSRTSVHRELPSPAITSSVTTPGVINLCVSIPAPDMRAYLLVGSMRTPLGAQHSTDIETTSCRSFSADVLWHTPQPAIEIRDLTGNSRRIFLGTNKHPAGELLPCRLNTHALWKVISSSVKIIFSCSVQNGNPVQNDNPKTSGCAMKSTCPAVHWKIYGAKDKFGPYLLVGETDELQFRISHEAAKNLHFFYYTYQDNNGAVSRPQVIQKPSNE